MDSRVKRLSKWINSNSGRLLLIAIFAWLGIWGLFLGGRNDLDMVRRLIRDMGPELAGIVIAAVTIDALAGRRDEQERKAQLIQQLGSKNRAVTETAVIELRRKGWLSDGSLTHVSLPETNLSGADLEGAKLSGAVLEKADLSRAYLAVINLSGANLQAAELSGAILWKADLSTANLWKANLVGADLQQAHLSDTDFGEASLSGTDLRDADLRGADLRQADLSGANLSRADLSRANLRGTNLNRAIMRGTDLRETRHWTIEQIEQAAMLMGTIMPDEVQLQGMLTEEWSSRYIKGPTFAEWKAQYLAKQETEGAEREPNSATNNAADGPGESGSPGSV